MTTLIAALLGAVVGLGLFLVLVGVRGVPVALAVLPAAARRRRGQALPSSAWASSR